MVNMTKKKDFGGIWTVEKLEILSKYLAFYVTALKNQTFEKIYIDAFAGTGKINVGGFDQIMEGSAKLALKVPHKFDRYIFIEKDKNNSSELHRMVNEQFPDLIDRIKIYTDDCNTKLQEICAHTDWKVSRAILFLDPYATEVKWETLETVAATKAIDLWYLFPVSAANRLLKKDGDLEFSWRRRLNLIFGDVGWYEEFYKKNPQMDIFGETDRYIKEANFNSLTHYINKRLNTIFPAVAPNPRMLYNTKNSPLFLFCFAVSNPRAINLALKGARHILDFKGK